MYSGAFARHYDALTADVDYPARARYFDRLIKKYKRREGDILLDLCCGTGSLSWELAQKGYGVIGVDASPEMLARAAAKGAGFVGASPPLFLCQQIEQLDLYGTVDACVCALDSLNHLPDLRALGAAFSRVSLFLAPGGVFLFDLNTRYKHRQILRGNTFVRQTGQVLCLWRNAYRRKSDRIEVTLDFFEQSKGGLYRRETEQFSERVFTHRQVAGLLKRTGLALCAVCDGDTLRPPRVESQRLVYAVRKPHPKRRGTPNG